MMLSKIFKNIQNNNKNTIIVLIILIVVVIILRIYNYKNEQFENPDYDILTTRMDSSSGFFSNLQMKLNHYLYAKKYDLDFNISTHSQWPYTFKDGWTDYFEDVKLVSSKNKEDKKEKEYPGCCNILEHFPLRDYINILPEFYKYNSKTKKLIEDKTKELGLNKGEYGAIYIRRGDKLVNETDFNEASKFVDILLDKYPECNAIFVQTDDYNSYLETKEYIHEKLNKKDIRIITLCPDNVFGSIANEDYTKTMKENNKVNEKNKEYMNKINNNLAKPIADMSLQERYEHTIELLTSVDICSHSRTAVCDFESNVSRFIKLFHDDFNSVYDVKNQHDIINLDSKVCLVYPIKSPGQIIS
jgi:hypothetical protein